MQFPSLLELAMYMWLIVVFRTSDYWLGTPPHVSLMVLVEVEVWFVSLSWGTRCVPRGSRGLILGSTGRGRPFLYPASVFPTLIIPSFSKKVVFVNLYFVVLRLIIVSIWNMVYCMFLVVMHVP